MPIMPIYHRNYEDHKKRRIWELWQTEKGYKDLNSYIDLLERDVIPIINSFDNLKFLKKLLQLELLLLRNPQFSYFNRKEILKLILLCLSNQDFTIDDSYSKDAYNLELNNFQGKFWFQTLQGLKVIALHFPTFIEKFLENDGGFHRIEIISSFGLISQLKICFLTKDSFPGGGGESATQDQAKFLSALGYEVIWVSFMKRIPSIAFFETKVYDVNSGYREVKWPGGMNHFNIENVVLEYNPDIVVLQGDSIKFADWLLERFSLPSIQFFHFWSHLVKLFNDDNSKVMQNLQHHSKSESLPKTGTKLLASEFMANVCTLMGLNINFSIAYPATLESSLGVKPNNRNYKQNILQINVLPEKGGNFFRKLLQDSTFSNIRFSYVANEISLNEESGDKDSLSGATRLDFAEPNIIYRDADILLALSQVDETFCRTAYEAAVLDIPVICTNKGNLAFMFGEKHPFISDYEELVNLLQKILTDPTFRNEIVSNQKDSIKNLKVEGWTVFLDSVLETPVAKSKVAFFGPVGVQGLTKQIAWYQEIFAELPILQYYIGYSPYQNIHTLTETDYQTFFHNCESQIVLEGDRESIDYSQVINFILINNIEVLVWPEICWQINWEKIELIKKHVPKLQVVHIPNSETLRKEDFSFYNLADLTLAPTRESYNIMKTLGVKSVDYLGTAYPVMLANSDFKFQSELRQDSQKIQMIHVAGHNPLSRKRTDKIIKTFSMYQEFLGGIHLTIIVSSKGEKLLIDNLPDNISMIMGPISEDDLNKYLRSAHVGLYMSSHEGIGLNIHEMLSRNKPVVCIDSPPMNESIIEGITGWLVPATPIPLPDNNDGYVTAWDFREADLATVLASITPLEVKTIGNNMREDNINFANYIEMLKTFTSVLRHIRKNNLQRYGMNRTQIFKLRIKYLIANTVYQFARKLLNEQLYLYLRSKYRDKKIVKFLRENVTAPQYTNLKQLIRTLIRNR
jgi:glycosyltransferase involved in cell wall biosynthesis